MAYEHHDGCINLIMFVIFAFFVIVIFFKGCVSCADEVYKSYNIRRNRKLSISKKVNLFNRIK